MLKYKFQKYHQNHWIKTYSNIALHVLIIDRMNHLDLNKLKGYNCISSPLFSFLSISSFLLETIIHINGNNDIVDSVNNKKNLMWYLNRSWPCDSVGTFEIYIWSAQSTLAPTGPYQPVGANSWLVSVPRNFILYSNRTHLYLFRNVSLHVCGPWAHELAPTGLYRPVGAHGTLVNCFNILPPI